MTTVTNEPIIDGLRFAESVRNLDDRTALKISLALAGSQPVLFSKLLEIVRNQNLAPAPKSTLQLVPVPATVASTGTKG